MLGSSVKQCCHRAQPGIGRTFRCGQYDSIADGECNNGPVGMPDSQGFKTPRVSFGAEVVFSSVEQRLETLEETTWTTETQDASGILTE